MCLCFGVFAGNCAVCQVQFYHDVMGVMYVYIYICKHALYQMINIALILHKVHGRELPYMAVKYRST